VQDPTTPLGVLLFWSAVTGIAGANSATSMAVVTLWFPKSKQGAALGINGLGNLGVTVAELLVPVVIAAGIFGAFGGFFPPLFLGGCIERFGSPAWAYTAMAVVALGALAVNGWFSQREGSPTRC